MKKLYAIELAIIIFFCSSSFAMAAQIPVNPDGSWSGGSAFPALMNPGISNGNFYAISNSHSIYTFAPYDATNPDYNFPLNGGTANGLWTICFNGGMGAPCDTSTYDYLQFYVFNGTPFPSSASAPTQFTSEEISTTTHTIVVTGNVNAADLSSTGGVKYSLNVSTPIYSTWSQDSFSATTSGTFTHTFQYTASFASTTIEQFTFSGQLYSVTGNPFNNASSTSIFDTFSTTTFPGTEAGFLTPAQIEVGIADNCKPFSSFWSVGLCLQYLLYPSPDQVSANITSIRDGLLNRVPVGYVTRIVSILASTSTTPLPVISYTWQNDGGPLAGDNLSFNLDSYFAQASALQAEMVSNTDHKTAWEIFGPFVNMFLAIVLIYGIIHDVMGLRLINHRR